MNPESDHPNPNPETDHPIGRGYKLYPDNSISYAEADLQVPRRVVSYKERQKQIKYQKQRKQFFDRNQREIYDKLKHHKQFYKLLKNQSKITYIDDDDEWNRFFEMFGDITETDIHDWYEEYFPQ